MTVHVMSATDWAYSLAFDEDGYPSDEMVANLSLVEVKTWDDCEVILEALQHNWRWPSYFERAPRRRRHAGDLRPTRLWRVSTGGWSGHEALLGALERNFMFWVLAYRSHTRGGHYVFATERDR